MPESLDSFCLISFDAAGVEVADFASPLLSDEALELLRRRLRERFFFGFSSVSEPEPIGSDGALWVP